MSTIELTNEEILLNARLARKVRTAEDSAAVALILNLFTKKQLENIISIVMEMMFDEEVGPFPANQNKERLILWLSYPAKEKRLFLGLFETVPPTPMVVGTPPTNTGERDMSPLAVIFRQWGTGCIPPDMEASSKQALSSATVEQLNELFRVVVSMMFVTLAEGKAGSDDAVPFTSEQIRNWLLASYEKKIPEFGELLGSLEYTDESREKVQKFCTINHIPLCGNVKPVRLFSFGESDTKVIDELYRKFVDEEDLSEDEIEAVAYELDYEHTSWESLPVSSKRKWLRSVNLLRFKYSHK